MVLNERESLLFALDEHLSGLAADIRVHITDTASSSTAAAQNTITTEALLREFRPEILVCAWSSPTPPAGYLESPDCPVRLVCFLTGSVRRIVPRAFLERGGLVTNWGDVAAPMVAEQALLLLLASLRRMPDWSRVIARGIETRNEQPIPVATRTLHGANVSLHGFGQIARELLRLLAPFNVRVRAYSEGVPAEYMRSFGVEPVSSLEALFQNAGLLVEVEALTPASRGSVNAHLINLLPDGAIFVNIGRGAVVDEHALARRAATGEIRLALDVLAEEPMPADSPLRTLPDLIHSPHIGGPTKDGLPLATKRAVENIRRYLAGEPLIQPVTLAVFDRST